MDDEDDSTRKSVNPQPPFVPTGPTYWRRGFVWGLLSGWILVFLPYAVILLVTTLGKHDGPIPRSNGTSAPAFCYCCPWCRAFLAA